jgi:predicted AlkP superfamily pyrophosphatase or phosphodiesterase
MSPASEGKLTGIRWLLGVAWLLQVGASSQVLSAQAGQQSVVLVALDGFHPSYLDRPVSSHLQSLARRGVRARWLVPVFPTKTFPNFYSIATGLYPEHHGIVSNTMRDSVLGRFALWRSGAVRDPRWWGGEPIWVTAVRQGRRAASFFWPGSDVAIQGVRPNHYRMYDRRVPNADRVRQVLEWLSLTGEQSLSLITLYLGDVDDAGHVFGPDAPETDSAIARVDSAVGALVGGIRARGLEHRVNLVVVSDHGMARVDSRQVVYLDDYIDPGSINLVDQGPFVSLTPVGVSVDELYRRLSRAHPRLTIYRKSEVPAAYHYRNHPRIPPIIGTLSDGWRATTRRAAAAGGRSLGDHGYPPERESMRAIFLAHGPAFRDGAVVEPFQNIHIYALLAHVLGLRPAPNDGRLDSVRVMLAAPERD